MRIGLVIIITVLSENIIITLKSSETKQLLVELLIVNFGATSPLVFATAAALAPRQLLLLIC